MRPYLSRRPRRPVILPLSSRSIPLFFIFWLRWRLSARWSLCSSNTVEKSASPARRHRSDPSRGPIVESSKPNHHLLARRSKPDRTSTGRSLGKEEKEASVCPRGARVHASPCVPESVSLTGDAVQYSPDPISKQRKEPVPPDCL